jgi:hypothetical protein
MEDAKFLIRYNEYTIDPISNGDPANAIASRYDLRTTNVSRFNLEIYFVEERENT